MASVTVAALLLTAYDCRHLSSGMTPERLRRIEELYHSARESGAAALSDADPELREAVQRLLAQDTESGGKLLDQSAAGLIGRISDAPIAVGSRLGPYKIESLLGAGGM